MTSAFQARTSHGTVLAIDLPERRLRHVPADGPGPSTVTAYLLTGGALGQRCLPFGLDPVTRRPIVPRGWQPGCGGPLLHVVPNGEASTLLGAVSNRFLSAIPGGVLEERTQVSQWERFTLLPAMADEALADAGVAHFVGRASTILAPSLPWADSMAAVLAAAPSETMAALAEAVWPMLTLDEFDRLAEGLRHDRTLSGKLLELFPRDFYAVTALPALLHWSAAREPSRPGARRWQAPAVPPGALPAAPSPTPPVTIGPERDHLARDGYDGQLASFAHACNAALRAGTAPTRGTAIVATARSEGVYLLEWIAYHRLIGIEAIYLYTNDNEDGSDALLAALHAAGAITWTRSVLAAGTSAQNKAYGHALNASLGVLDHRWALLIDLDEFLVLNPDRYAGIADFARRHEMRQTDAVGINWVMVGSSGQSHWSDAPLTRRNTDLLTEPNAHLKTMLAPRRFIQAHPHFPFADARRTYSVRLAGGAVHEHRKQPAGRYHARAFSDDPSDVDACLYHYNFKSVEELAWKVARNRGDSPLSHEARFDGLDGIAVGSFVAQHDSLDVTRNDRLARCAPGLDAEIARLRALPGVAAADQAVQSQFRKRLDLVKAELLASPVLARFGSDGEEMRTLLQATR